MDILECRVSVGKDTMPSLQPLHGCISEHLSLEWLLTWKWCTSDCAGTLPSLGISVPVPGMRWTSLFCLNRCIICIWSTPMLYLLPAGREQPSPATQVRGMCTTSCKAVGQPSWPWGANTHTNADLSSAWVKHPIQCLCESCLSWALLQTMQWVCPAPPVTLCCPPHSGAPSLGVVTGAISSTVFQNAKA